MSYCAWPGAETSSALIAELELSNCAHLDDAALYWLLGLTRLDSLGLAGCVRVTDIGLCLLGSKLTDLRQLNLNGCYEVRACFCWPVSQPCRRRRVRRRWRQVYLADNCSRQTGYSCRQHGM